MPSSDSSRSNKKWSNLLPLFLVLVFIAEITFLGRLDFIKNSNNNDLFDSWLLDDDVAMIRDVALTRDTSSDERCEEWLERVDAVVYSRDFNKEPVVVTGGEQEWKSCAVECKFGFSNKKADAVFGLPPGADTAGVLRSMESAQYYPENNIATARRWDIQQGGQCSPSLQSVIKEFFPHTPALLLELLPLIHLEKTL